MGAGGHLQCPHLLRSGLLIPKGAGDLVQSSVIAIGDTVGVLGAGCVVGGGGAADRVSFSTVGSQPLCDFPQP